MAQTIQVYGTDWCHSTFGVREYLMNARLEYDFFDIARDQRADEFVRAVNGGARRYPVVVFPDEIVTNPTVTQLGSCCASIAWNRNRRGRPKPSPRNDDGRPR